MTMCLLMRWGGDEDEAFEFRQAFSMLASDIEAFQDDLSEQWVPDCFDTFLRQRREVNCWDMMRWSKIIRNWHKHTSAFAKG